jgi:phosphatidylserine/phosphatidylglycerophosphate/cardiolipin synthase-like enzyme
MRKVLLGIVAVVCLLHAAPARAERLCDPAGEDCRALLINLIRAERTGLDVAFWFMEDARYSAEIIRRFQAGVPVRVLFDTRANPGHPVNAQIVEQLRVVGIPIRQRVASGILHWKMMLFAGQQQVEFSGANYSPDALVFTDPYRNYVDEAILFSDEPATVRSFMQKFDDLWTNTTAYANYANVTALRRSYANFPISPELNFPPAVSYRDRAVSAYNAERSGIDVIMYRITDRAHTDAVIAAMQRGVRVRLITEQVEYRNAARPWHSWNVDRLYMAGAEIRHRAHAGLNHQKSVILKSQGLSIFGSSNWTSPSNQSQEEHNEFTTKPWVFQWFTQQFERKWNNTAIAPETQPFVPLPPSAPVNLAPANGATKLAQNLAISFDAGPFAHLYDIYLGTTPTPPLIASDVPLGPNENGTPRTYQLPPLNTGTTYYWRVVAKTMALQGTAGPVWSFTTGGPVTPVSRPAMSIDTPGNGASVRQPFLLGGWALDTGPPPATASTSCTSMRTRWPAARRCSSVKSR